MTYDLIMSFGVLIPRYIKLIGAELSDRRSRGHQPELMWTDRFSNWSAPMALWCDACKRHAEWAIVHRCSVFLFLPFVGFATIALFWCMKYTANEWWLFWCCVFVVVFSVLLRMELHTRKIHNGIKVRRKIDRRNCKQVCARLAVPLRTNADRNYGIGKRN